MSDAAEFFLGSAPSVARYDCLEIAHPNFSQTYRLVRNNPNGLVVTQGVETISWVFDGVDDRIDFGAVLNLERTEPFTLSIWFQTTDSPAQRLLSNEASGTTSRGYTLSLRSGGQLNFQLSNNQLATANTLTIVSTDNGFNDGDVHHFLVTYDGSSGPGGVAFYLDGVAISMTTHADTLSATVVGAGELTIGSINDGVQPFQGVLRDGAIWDSELSPTEAAEAYGGGVPPNLNALATAPAPVFWAKLDSSDTSGSGGVIDHGSTGADGTSTFDPTVVDDGLADYQYCPARVLPIASEDDLVQSLSVTLGDVGEIIAAEIANVWAANGMDTRPTLTYRAYRSDDLSAPIEGSERVLEIAGLSRSREGCSFEARAPEINASRTGELYTVERFPMLAGFQ